MGKRDSGGLRWSDLYHYRITFDDAGENVTLLLQTGDRLDVGSVVEHKGRLVAIRALDAIPYRGVVTPLSGELV